MPLTFMFCLHLLTYSRLQFLNERHFFQICDEMQYKHKLLKSKNLNADTKMNKFDDDDVIRNSTGDDDLVTELRTSSDESHLLLTS